MPETVCPLCEGTGWRIVDREGVSGAERCTCVPATRARRVEGNAGIPPLYQNASFENFSLRKGLPAIDSLSWQVTQVRNFASNFPVANSKPGLLLIGNTGTGKTHLAVAALRRILAKGFEGIFYDYQNLLDRIRAGFDSNSGASEKEAYRFAMETPVLLLDDLGAHRVLEWIQDTVTAILTYRCNHNLPLIATTNLPERAATRNPDGTSDYGRTLADVLGERAHSRLFEMCNVVRMPAIEDYRLSRSATF